MTAGKWSFVIEQGATFTQTLLWKDANGNLISLAGFTARMHIREYVSDVDTTFELTTENGRIILTDPGKIDLKIDAQDTRTINIKQGVYDLEIVNPLVSPEIVKRLVEGQVVVALEVTR